MDDKGYTIAGTFKTFTFTHTQSIYLNEELRRYKSITQCLTNSTSAMALVNLDYRLIFTNPAFNNLIALQSGDKLPTALIEIINKESVKFDPSNLDMDCNIELPFYQLYQGVFRVSCSLLNSEREFSEQCWLLKLKPAIEPYSKLNLFMQKAGLSNREMEIAILVCDGMENAEIAKRLFISLHTVRTYLRNMHEKLGVSSRAKLVATLNQAQNENPDK